MKILKTIKKHKELKKWREERDYAMRKMEETVHDVDDSEFKFYTRVCIIANEKIFELNESN